MIFEKLAEVGSWLVGLAFVGVLALTSTMPESLTSVTLLSVRSLPFALMFRLNKTSTTLTNPNSADSAIFKSVFYLEHTGYANNVKCNVYTVTILMHDS